MENLREDLDYADEDALVEELISDWTFFLPSPTLSREILFQNDKLGSDYFKKESSQQDYSFEENDAADLETASKILFHESLQTEASAQSEEEFISDLQAFISERIFNHLAMLSRTNYAKTGVFSIREELTIELAEKLGLGIYLHEKTSAQLREETEKILLKLAWEFQRWLIRDRRGIFYATWGAIFSVDKQDLRLNGPENSIVVEPDVNDSDG